MQFDVERERQWAIWMDIEWKMRSKFIRLLKLSLKIKLLIILIF